MGDIIVGEACEIKQVYVEGGFTWCGKHQRPIGECEADYAKAQVAALEAEVKALRALSQQLVGHAAHTNCRICEAALSRGAK